MSEKITEMVNDLLVEVASPATTNRELDVLERKLTIIQTHKSAPADD